MSVPRSRLLDLMKVQCRIFATTYNPEGIRTGNKILRQRLRGPALVAYYPRHIVDVEDLRKAMGPGIGLIDEDFEDVIEHNEKLRERGKGRPTKSRTSTGGDAKAKGKK